MLCVHSPSDDSRTYPRRCTSLGFVWGLAAALVLGAPLAAQTTIHVPADQPTIQAAIDLAVAGDTVLVAPGTYAENIDFLGKAITVESSGGPAVTTIDGGGSGPVVVFANGESRASVLEGFTLTNGDGGVSGGGGIRIQSSSPTVRDNDVVNNISCTSGGGIKVNFASPLIEGNFIAGNGQSGCSGGSGGGIYVGGAAAAEIVGNVIANNSWGFGGGISLFAAGDPILRDNVITGNVASNSGGGIDIVNRSDALIVQNLIVGNSAGKGGGIFWLVPSGARGPFLVNNTIAFNDSAQGSGVLVDGYDVQAQLVNNVIVANPGQTAVLCDDFNDLNPPFFGFNNVYSASGSAYGGICVDQTGSGGNISADPLFVDSAAGDYHLQAGSPSIEAGDNNNPDLPATDIDGDPRIFDGDGDQLAVVDQGYDELFFVNTPPTVTITAPADGSRFGVGEAVTFSASALDPEDGDLSGDLAWASDLDGTIGSGGTFVTASLSVGTHLITASVVDSHGAPGSDAVTVIVKVPIQVTFTSVDTEDGWVRESSETSGVGGSFTATGPGNSDKGIDVGDDKKDRQLKGFLSFETATIPDGAILRSADLRLRRKMVKGTSPFATHGALYADVRTGGFGGSSALEASDFEAAATAVAAATLSEPLADGDYSEGAFDASGLAAINVAGTTQVRLYFDLDDDDDRRDDMVEYFSGDNTDPGTHPQLIVEYLD